MDLNGTILKFQEVGKTFLDRNYHKVVALAHVTFSVDAGEFISVVGPSGCGKSTILRIAAGLEDPTSGTVEFAGHAVQGPGRERGLVFQSYNAFPWLTVRENVAFGLTSPQPADIIDRWLQDMGLAEFANVYPKALSGGMRQRLAIARAMIVEPKLLLLDEPFGALDERTRSSMQELLLAVTTRNHCTVLLVTHDIREAVLLSHRIIVISARPGRIQDIVESTLATPRSREQLKTPEFERLYQHVSDQWLPEPPPSLGTRHALRGGGA